MKTPITLKMAEGEPVIAWPVNDRYERGKMFDDGQEGKSGFFLFPNVDSATSLMLAYESFSFPPMAPAMGVPVDAGEGSGPLAHTLSRLYEISDPSKLVAPFGDNPTASKIADAKCAIETWHHESEYYLLIPLRDCIAVSRDLRSLLTTLLFSIGSSSFENLKKTLEEGFIFANEGCNGCDCYENHILGFGDLGIKMLRGGYPLFNESKKTPGSLAILDYDEAVIKRECGEFSSYAINIFMGDVHPKIDEGSFAIAGTGQSLGNAYAFWAEKALTGKAGVCDHCGNLFVRRRNTKKYCSDSCKVSASLARASK